MSALPRYRFAGGTAVVTGEASGIGEHLAHGLARRGSALVLLDRDADRLGAVQAALRAAHPQVQVAAEVVDLADPAAIAAAAGHILAEHPRITLLVNNAGIALTGRFEQLTLAEFDAVIAVNFRAPVVLTHHLLPALRRSPGSHLVNVSSVFGLMAVSGQSAYSSSKFALRGFSEVLRQELARQRIGVTTVYPGGIRTRIAETALRGSGVGDTESAVGQRTAARLLTYPPERAAEQILDAVEHRRARVLITRSARLPDLLVRVTPAHYAGGPSPASAAPADSAPTSSPAGSAAAAAPGAVSQQAHPGGEDWVTVHGARIRYRLDGDPSQPTVVPLHGIGRSLEDWSEQRELAGDLHLVGIDLPGFGFSEPLPGPVTLRGLAQGVLTVLDAVGGPPTPVHLVGNSLGGAVALQILALDPARVASLTLVSSAGFGAEVALALRLLAVPGLGARLLRRPDRASAYRIERAIFVDRTLVTDARLDLAVRLAQQPHRARVMRETSRHLGTIRGIRPGWRTALLRAVAEHPRPTLVLWGDRDLVLPSHHLQAARAQLPHAQVHEFAHTRHMPQIERAEEFNRQLRGFVSSAEVSRRGNPA